LSSCWQADIKEPTDYINPFIGVTIIAHDNSNENIYIQSMKLNEKTLDRYWISNEEIINGGKLELQMGNEPIIN
jgi:putative alpha-1,2-mannosidase